MSDYLSTARECVQRARETTDQSTLREQLDSLDEGLKELTGGDRTEGSNPAEETGRLQEIEKKLMGLLEETSGETEDHLREARDAIDRFRQEHTDWDEPDESE